MGPLNRYLVEGRTEQAVTQAENAGRGVHRSRFHDGAGIFTALAPAASAAQAGLLFGLVLIAIVLLVDIRSAIGFSSFTVLLYYAVTNLAAYTLGMEERRYSRKLAAVGLLGCVVLAFTLPPVSVIGAAP